MRILVSFDESHYSYGEVIARVIEHLRPGLEVSVAEARAFASEMSRLRPDVVISDQPKAEAPAVLGGAVAWMEIPTDPNPVSRICVGGKCRRSHNPSFDEVLAVVDEAEILSG